MANPADPAHLLTDLMLEELIKQILIIYSQASTEMQKKAMEYLQWFEVADAAAQNQLKAGEITKEEYQNWRMSHLLTSQYFNEMADVLARDMVHADAIASSIINGYLPDVYAENFNWGTYEVEHGTMIDTSFTLYDHQTIERLIRDNPDLVPWRSVVKYPEAERWNKQLVSSTAAQSILQGEDIPTMAKRIADTLPTRNQNAAVRDARTIVTSAENGGRIDAYKRAENMGISLKKVWMATLDGRTRHTHRQLDGQTQPLDKPFTVDGDKIDFPGDPNALPALVYNCRCTMMTQIEGFEIDMATTSPKLGEMSYEEWKYGKRENWESELTNAEKSGIILSDEQKELQRKVRSGEISLDINQEVQNRHYRKTYEHEALLEKGINKSYFIVPVEDLQHSLLTKYGMGEISTRGDSMNEVIDFGYPVAYDTKLNDYTSFVKIFYSKNRTHMAPFTPQQ